MTCVTLKTDKNGLFVSCRAAGHAGAGARGQDIVCSAVTAILRTVMQVISLTEGADLITKSKEDAVRGELYFEARKSKSADEKTTDTRLVCVADFVESGITALSKEYPRNVKLIRR